MTYDLQFHVMNKQRTQKEIQSKRLSSWSLSYFLSITYIIKLQVKLDLQHLSTLRTSLHLSSYSNPFTLKVNILPVALIFSYEKLFLVYLTQCVKCTCHSLNGVFIRSYSQLLHVSKYLVFSKNKLNIILSAVFSSSSAVGKYMALILPTRKMYKRS